METHTYNEGKWQLESEGNNHALNATLKSRKYHRYTWPQLQHFQLIRSISNYSNILIDKAKSENLYFTSAMLFEVKGTCSRLQFGEALRQSHHHPPSQANPWQSYMHKTKKENTKTMNRRQKKFGILK